MSRFFFTLFVLVLIVGELDASIRSRTKKRKPYSTTMVNPASNLFRLSLNKQKTSIAIGDSLTKLDLLINTDSPYNNLNINGCLAPNLLGPQCYSKAYDPRTSKSGKFDKNNLREYTDDLHFGSHSIKQFEFRTSVCEDTCTWCMPCGAGSIGLGPESLKTPKSFVNQATKAGLFSKPQYTVRFDAQKDNRFTGKGEVVFGGVDTKKCAKPNQPISILYKERNYITNSPVDWTFRLSNYSFVYNGKNQFDDYAKEIAIPTEVKFSVYQEVITLPYNMFNKLSIVAHSALDVDFAISCNSKLEFKFQLKDESSGKTIDWTLNEKDLFVKKIETPYSGTKCLLAIKSESQWSDNRFKIIIGQPLYQNACVLHDLEKQSVSLSRRLN